MTKHAFIALALIVAAPALAQQAAPQASPYYSSEAAVAPVPPPSMPPIPAWTLKPAGAKPFMGQVGKGPGLDGPNIVDFAAVGYVEEEYFLTGKANVYTQEGKAIAQKDVPYTTRILVRRPKDPAKFSGFIVMEPSRDVNEWTTSWPAAAGVMLKNGDIFVAFTMAKANIPDFFLAYDKDRYASITIAHEGLRWDILAQTAALLRDPTGPLGKLGYLARAGQIKGGLKLISTGASLTAGMQGTFINNGHHARARRPVIDNGGGPLIDGYLMLVGGSPRILPDDAAVISLVSEGDMQKAARKSEDVTDMDAGGPIGPRFRWYELSGSSHANWADQSQFTPAFQLTGKKETNTIRCATPVSETAAKGDFATAALVNLESWLRDGVAPPKGAVIARSPDGAIARDQYGNAQGGLRPYWVEVPAAKITPTSKDAEGFKGVSATGGLCSMFANETPLPAATLAKLYPTHAAYVAKVDDYLKKQVAEHYLTPDGAARELAMAKAAKVP